MAAAREPLVVGRRVVGDVDGVEPGGFGRRGHLPDRRAGDELVGVVDVVDREAHAESHGRTLPSRPPTLRRTAAMTSLTIDDIDLSDIEFWAQPDAEREAVFQLLRDEAPITFYDEID